MEDPLEYIDIIVQTFLAGHVTPSLKQSFVEAPRSEFKGYRKTVSFLRVLSPAGRGYCVHTVSLCGIHQITAGPIVSFPSGLVNCFKSRSFFIRTGDGSGTRGKGPRCESSKLTGYQLIKGHRGTGVMEY